MTRNILRAVSAVLAALLLLPLISCTGDSDENDDHGSSDRPRRPSWFNKTETETVRPVFAEASGVTVLIDPGHGFGDDGLVSPFVDTTEAKITLTVAEMISSELISRGYNVIMTHDGKRFPSTIRSNGDGLFDDPERIEYTNSLSADILISLHCGTSFGDGSEDVRGVRLYYSTASSVSSAEPKDLCEKLKASLQAEYPSYKAPIIYAEEKDGSFYITGNSDKCTVLAVIGYLSNSEDAHNLSDARWQTGFASAVCNGIDDYFIDKSK